MTFSAPLRSFTVLAIIGLVVALPGCGGPGVEVHGKVTYNNVPVDNGTIVFEPEDGQGASQGGKIRGGTYVLNGTARLQPGANIVRIRAMRSTGKQVAPFPGSSKLVEDIVQYIPTRFNSASTLRQNIEPGKNNEANFELTGDTPIPGPAPTEDPLARKPDFTSSTPPRAYPPSAPEPTSLPENYQTIDTLVLLCRLAAGVILVVVLIGVLVLVLGWASVAATRRRPKKPLLDGPAEPRPAEPDAGVGAWLKLAVLAFGIVGALALLATAEMMLLAMRMEQTGMRVEQNTRQSAR